MTRRAWAAAVCVWCLLGAAACSDDGGGEAPAGNNAANNSAVNNAPNNSVANNNPPDNNDPTPVSCTSDEGCGVSEVCDEAAGFCRAACADDAACRAAERCGAGGFCEARSACSAADGCGAGEVCNTCAGQCEAPPQGAGRACTVDMNCRVEEFCDPCRKVCRPLGSACDPCQEDVECGGAGDLCLDFALGGRFCGAACATDTECPLGFGCGEVSGGARQCVPLSGECSRPGACESDDECPSGLRCGPRLSCVAGCTEGSCPNGEVCDNGSCKAPCASAADCVSPAECTPEGLCRVPGGCATSRECPEAGTYCDLTVNMCMPGCESDADCPGTQVCSDNTCRRRPCEGNFQCAFGQVCNQGTGACEEAQGPYCDMCDADAEDQCGGEPNQCLRLQDEDGNALGDFCGVACTPGERDACPVGYSCEELMDENMQVVGAVCFRACHREPI